MGEEEKKVYNARIGFVDNDDGKTDFGVNINDKFIICFNSEGMPPDVLKEIKRAFIWIQQRTHNDKETQRK